MALLLIVLKQSDLCFINKTTSGMRLLFCSIVHYCIGMTMLLKFPKAYLAQRILSPCFDHLNLSEKCIFKMVKLHGCFKGRFVFNMAVFKEENYDMLLENLLW